MAESNYSDDECERVAHKLHNGDYDHANPSSAEGDVGERISEHPFLSDLIFNYLCTAMSFDNPQGDQPTPTIDETALALSLLANVFEIEPEDLAKHYNTRL